MSRAWGTLVVYVAFVYAVLPLAPRVGLALAGTWLGAWLLGSGLALLACAGVGALVVLLHRHRAPLWAYATLLGAAIVYAYTFRWLRAQHLERTHLPEYGVMAFLAWRAVAPLVPGVASGYVAAAVLGAAIGYGDELLQSVVPGRVYDLRDVGMNALGAALGIAVLAAARARRPRPADLP